VRTGLYVYALFRREIACGSSGKPSRQPLASAGGGRNRNLRPSQPPPLWALTPLVAGNTAGPARKGYRHIKLQHPPRALRAAQMHPAPAARASCSCFKCAWSPPVAREMAASLRGDGLAMARGAVWPPEELGAGQPGRRVRHPEAARRTTSPACWLQLTARVRVALDIAQPSVTKIGRVGANGQGLPLCQAPQASRWRHTAPCGPGSCHVHVAAAMSRSVDRKFLARDGGIIRFWSPGPRLDGKVRITDGPGLAAIPIPDHPQALDRARRRAPNGELSL